MRYSEVFHLLGILLLFISPSFFLPLLTGLYYQEPILPFLATQVITLLLGYVLASRFTVHDGLTHKEGFLIVALGWLLMALIGAIPYLFFQISPLDSLFHSMSGFTTTGSSIMDTVEAFPHSLLMWRSLTHWRGGMGILLLAIAIFPLLGIGGMQLFKAETSGPTHDKITPRITQTAKILWGVYVLLTFLAFILLLWGGMSVFDAFIHAVGTIATGGFSSKTASVGFYNSPFIETVLIIFMFLSGVNFALHYQLLRGKPLAYFRNTEFLFYTLVVFLAVAFITLNLSFTQYPSFFEALRYGSFQAISLVTSTGFVTADFDQWPWFSRTLLFMLMFFSGCVGSTSGGIKMMRIYVLLRHGLAELHRAIHPAAIKNILFNHRILSADVTKNIISFVILYITLFFIMTLFLTALGLDLITAGTAVATTMANTGPGFELAGPTESFAAFPSLAKLLLAFSMLLGRLEIYTILVLFLPEFWRR